MTSDNPIADLLAAPLSPEWTVEGLAEHLLGTIAARQSEAGQEFVFDADTTADRQSRRLLRPLLACLAIQAAAEAGSPVNLYGGHLSFKRPSPEGPVWILGRFENRPGTARVALRRSSSPPEAAQSGAEQPPTPTGAGFGSDASQATTMRSAAEIPTSARTEQLQEDGSP